MTDDQIKHMTERFLAWKLPDNFNPDGGIKFEPVVNLGTEHQYRHKPIGTNLLTYTQAEAMVRHMLEGLPAAQGMAAAIDAHSQKIAKRMGAVFVPRDYDAQVGTHPKGGDAKQAPGESLSDAVGNADAPGDSHVD